jgi:DNA-directed RNA polymerase specialized sigma24 family protein
MRTTATRRRGSPRCGPTHGWSTARTCADARGRAPLPVGEAIEDAASSAAPAADLRHDEELWAAVRRLPPKQRTAVALRYALDADYALIAQTMSVSQEAARRSVHEGLKRLRTEYER